MKNIIRRCKCRIPFLEAEDILRFDKGELTKVLYAESLMQPEKRA